MSQKKQDLPKMCRNNSIIIENLLPTTTFKNSEDYVTVQGNNGKEQEKSTGSTTQHQLVVQMQKNCCPYPYHITQTRQFKFKANFRFYF